MWLYALVTTLDATASFVTLVATATEQDQQQDQDPDPFVVLEDITEASHILSFPIKPYKWHTLVFPVSG